MGWPMLDEPWRVMSFGDVPGDSGLNGLANTNATGRFWVGSGGARSSGSNWVVSECQSFAMIHGI